MRESAPDAKTSRALDTAARAAARLFILEFELSNVSGHFFNQALGFGEAALALDLEPRLFIPAESDPDLARALDARAIIPRQSLPSEERDSTLNALLEDAQRLRPLWDAVEAEGIAGDDIVLITSES
jgi:hypothetical protein